MDPPLGLPWKEGVETEAPGQSGPALSLPQAKACELCSLPWLIMEMTVMRSQTHQVGSLHLCLPCHHGVSVSALQCSHDKQETESLRDWAS